jgi:hypothetical protein
MSETRRLKIWRGDKTGGEFREYEVPVDPGMVVLDAIPSPCSRSRRSR